MKKVIHSIPLKISFFEWLKLLFNNFIIVKKIAIVTPEKKDMNNISTNQIKRIIKLFADGDVGVWGYDMEIYATKIEAIKAVRKILEEKK